MHTETALVTIKPTATLRTATTFVTEAITMTKIPGFIILMQDTAKAVCINFARICISSTRSVVYHQTAEDTRRGVMIYSPQG